MDSDSNGPKRMSRGRRVGLSLIVVTGVLLGAVGLCEALLWMVAPIPYHEWMIWQAEGHIRARAMPNQVLKTAAGDEVRINKDGFRGPDYEYDKPAGTLRIAVFGGSAGFCYHAAGREKTWPGALELKLKQRLGMPVEVINLALPGFHSFNSRINYLCFGRAFHPDAIVVYHTWNDMRQFRSLETRPYHSFGMRGTKPLWQRIARATQIGRRARNFLWTVTKRKFEIKYRAEEGTEAGADQPIAPEAFAWERKNFEDFVILAKSDGVLPILVSQASLASPESLKDPAVTFAIAHGSEATGMTLPVVVDTWSRVSAIIERVARRHNVIFVDGYNAVPHELEYFQDHVHLHDAGSELLAEEIAKVLLANPQFGELVDRVRREVSPAK